MAYITVTNTLVNGNTADAGELNTNFTDIINGTSDGSKDFNIAALTCAGNVTFNGNTSIGNATSDTITFTARAASDFLPSADDTYDLGSSSLQWKQSYSSDFVASLGAVGTPSFTFNGDTNTGLYSSGSDTLCFSSGGSLSLNIDSTGLHTIGISGTYNDTTRIDHKIRGGLSFQSPVSTTSFKNMLYTSQDTNNPLVIRGGSTDTLGAIQLKFAVGSSSEITAGYVQRNKGWYIGATDSSNHTIVGLDDSTNGHGCLIYNTSTDLDTAALKCTVGNATESTGNHFVYFVAGSSGCGGIEAAGANSAQFFTYSDIRLKENITSLDSQLEKILLLNPVSFNFKDKSSKSVGFIAQEFETVYPEYIGSGKLIEGDDTDYKTIGGWSSSDARLVKAIQEQQSIIEELKIRLEALEGK